MRRMPVRVEYVDVVAEDFFRQAPPPSRNPKMETTHPLPGKQSGVDGFRDCSYAIPNECFSRTVRDFVPGPLCRTHGCHASRLLFYFHVKRLNALRMRMTVFHF